MVMGMPAPRERTGLSIAIAGQIRAEQARVQTTIEQTAKKSGIPYGTYRKIYDGSRTADAEQLWRLCRDVFGITLREFFLRVEQTMATQADDGAAPPNG